MTRRALQNTVNPARGGQITDNKRSGLAVGIKRNVSLLMPSGTIGFSNNVVEITTVLNPH